MSEFQGSAFVLLGLMGLLLMVLGELHKTRKIHAAQVAEARITNDLTRRQAANEAFRRLQAVRAEHAARDHRHHHQDHGQHGGGNASMPGAGCA